MTDLDPAPSEADLIRRFGLTVFDQKADWHLTDDGDLALTRDGDILVGSPSFNAMHRLVGGWRYNEPTMRLLFRSIRDSRAQRPRLTEEMERAHTAQNSFLSNPDPSQLAVYHAASDALDAGEVGCAAMAGSLMIIVALLLGRFRGDLASPSSAWNEARPQINGVSVGRLAIAAANAFRHADEWAEARHAGKFTRQQQNSMNTVRAALKLDPFVFSDMSEWECALDAISQGDFDRLAGAVLQFANNVAQDGIHADTI